jgi:hypothetical protein
VDHAEKVRLLSVGETAAGGVRLRGVQREVPGHDRSCRGSRRREEPAAVRTPPPERRVDVEREASIREEAGMRAFKTLVGVAGIGAHGLTEDELRGRTRMAKRTTTTPKDAPCDCQRCTDARARGTAATGAPTIDLDERIRAAAGTKPSLEEKRYLALAPERAAHEARVRALAEPGPVPPPPDLNRMIREREPRRLARGKSACV